MAKGAAAENMLFHVFICAAWKMPDTVQLLYLHCLFHVKKGLILRAYTTVEMCSNYIKHEMF